MTMQRSEQRSDSQSVRKEALDYSIEWFKIHADQRMRLFNFYLLVLGGFVLMSGTIFSEEKPILMVASGLLLSVASVVFQQLDSRISELIKTAEKSLIEIQRTYRLDLGIDEVEVVAASQIKDGTSSYSSSFSKIFLLGLFSGIALIVVGVILKISNR